ncbi:N-methyl-L-tryptophan oxidase [Cohnella xylanilytica]|uniref:N-methyl-L-tryptophan oxidase n=1 Tax=Cohnella xylanilytica TaxID=557555 RepID=A0A841U6K3_9BACL|nr:N-methyl-L-tryptophan oxidase [Cohnella xylanilytica]MBB6693620.1 N-methyl-L-tryptophan oxidase [Cohnella xylanilytica]
MVGAGSMGMSAGYHLAKQGVDTLLIDAFDPPHGEGSHHGEPRLIRHAYGGDSTYVSMALRAHAIWREIEELTGTKLLVPSGVLNMGPPDVYPFEERLAYSSLFKVPVERLGASDIQYRWPGIRLPEHYEGLYEPGAGYLFSEKCVSAFRTLAVERGATLLPYTRAESIQVSQGRVSIRTSNGIFHAEKLILSAGAWFKTLAPFVSLPIRPVRKAVGWFEADEALFDTGTFPGFTLATAEGGFYGFPSIGGSGVKIGRHDTGAAWKPGSELEPFGSFAEDEGDLRGALEAFMPRAAGKLLRGAVCKYELTPDEDFIIDRHPVYSNVLLAGGFSGHGFKFASVVGEILADLATGFEPRHDIRPFSLSRFGKEQVS